MGKIELPVYLNSTREDLLFTVDLPVQPVRMFLIFKWRIYTGSIGMSVFATPFAPSVDF
jgi:hypothetical protein